MEDGESAVRYVAELEKIQGLGPHVAGLVQDIDIKDIPRKIRRTMSSMSVYALYAAQEALAQAHVGQQLLTGGRLGIALGSTVGSVDTMEDFFGELFAEQKHRRHQSMFFSKSWGIPARQTSRKPSDRRTHACTFRRLRHRCQARRTGL